MTVLFHKGALLYNAFGARAATQKGAPLIAVEGYVDVIAMVEAGFEGAVAPLGTALTEEQLQLLWRMAEEPMLLFDGDKAGKGPPSAPSAWPCLTSSPERACLWNLARRAGPGRPDPRRRPARPWRPCWRRPSPWRPCCGRVKPKAQSGYTGTRAALEARIGEAVAAIQDENVRRHYKQDLNDRLKRLLSPGSEGRRFEGGSWGGRRARAAGAGLPAMAAAARDGADGSRARRRWSLQVARFPAPPWCAGRSPACRATRRCCCSACSAIPG